MHMNQPIDVAPLFIIPIFHQSACELVLGAIKPLSCQLYTDRLASPLGLQVLHNVAHLCIEMGFKEWQLVQVCVEGIEGGDIGAEEV